MLAKFFNLKFMGMMACYLWVYTFKYNKSHRTNNCHIFQVPHLMTAPTLIMYHHAVFALKAATKRSKADERLQRAKRRKVEKTELERLTGPEVVTGLTKQQHILSLTCHHNPAHSRINVSAYMCMH